MPFVVKCYDLLIKNGLVLDPILKLYKKADIGIYEPNIADIIEPGAFSGKMCAHRVIDAEGLYVVPGLIDGHVHVLPGFWFSYSIDEMWKRGITACLDMGSVSCASFSLNRRLAINNAPCTIKASLSLSSLSETAGIVPMYAALEHEIDKEYIKDLFQIHHDVLVGIKVFIGQADTPTKELTHEVLKKAREVCDYVDCPMIVHVASPLIELPEWIQYFRPGDNVTHTYNKGNILNERGDVYPEAWAAKERGVLFDSCRGSRNWSADVAKAAFDQGFFPDIISSDLTSLSNHPQTSRLDVHMSECMALGMSFEDVIERVTYAPAKEMKITTGIQRGNRANLTILELDEGDHMFSDAYGVAYEGKYKVVPRATIINGKVMFEDIGTDY